MEDLHECNFVGVLHGDGLGRHARAARAAVLAGSTAGGCGAQCGLCCRAVRGPGGRCWSDKAWRQRRRNVLTVITVIGNELLIMTVELLYECSYYY